MSTDYLLTAGDVHYPPLLKESPAYPRRLYLRGDKASLEKPCISVIGSRASTAYGEQIARLLVPSLVRAGLAVVSGLAYGIDSYVHELALKEKGTCIAVLGSGLDRIYPHRNQGLAEDIMATGGCLLSEYESDQGARRHHFPARNRIVAGLSPVLLILEAGERSGTLITAQQALEANRQICVVPGDVTRPGSRGIMKLLRQGAYPIETAEDVLQLYGEEVTLTSVVSFKPALTGSLSLLYDLVSCGVGTIDGLIEHSGLSVPELQSVLSVLELDGFIYYKENQWQKI